MRPFCLQWTPSVANVCVCINPFTTSGFCAYFITWTRILIRSCNIKAPRSTFYTYFGVCVSSTRFPSWNSWDLLRCSEVTPGSRWMSLRLGGGGVPGAFTLFRRRVGGVPGGVMVLTTKWVRGGGWPKCLWRGDGGRERCPESKAWKKPAAGLSTLSRSAYKGGARAWGLWHMCWLYLDWTLGLWESWNPIHWLASGWHTGVFSLPESEVGHWIDQSCFTWFPGREKTRNWMIQDSNAIQKGDADTKTALIFSCLTGDTTESFSLLLLYFHCLKHCF